MYNYEDKTLLVTGGTGSLGQAILKFIVRKNLNFRKVILFSRDEQKHFTLQQKYNKKQYPWIRHFIGDVRDLERCKRSLLGVDYVIHAAAMKHVPLSEYNPDECVKTNIVGAMNIIEASKSAGVKKIIALSTDKACSPVNLYGATKLASDKLFVASNNIAGNSGFKAAVVRYGNVLGSNGSVLPYFLKQSKSKKLTITDPEMTRFNITLNEGVELIFFALENSYGGEIIIPKLPSYRILDLAKAVNPNADLSIIGVRPGEKLHEEMVNQSDSEKTVILEDKMTILNDNLMENYPTKGYLAGSKPNKNKFSYNSLNNDWFETVESLEVKIKNYMNEEL